MNKINILPLGNLPDEHNDKRFTQTGRRDSYYRELTRDEIDLLEMQKNRCHDWSKILVTDNFKPMQVKLCYFLGTVRIDDMDAVSLEFHDIVLPVGLYNSNIKSCDIGKNCSVNRVSYMSHMILGEQVILKDINELVTSDHAKFGNGIVKDGEDPNGRIELEIANESGGREILPFENMLTPDAYLWYKYRGNKKLMNRFRDFVDSDYDSSRGYYGVIGDRTVVKNSKIIKDVIIGSDAYIKGCNKLKNLTIKSSGNHKTQIGEGCELVNGTIGEGCRIFYGAMAVRFHLMAHSSLKYGARLINSVLGENSTISCCEVLNSFIFPGHEQHHNSSFLIASVLMGQTNIASGATIGSNHNSRKNDGEIVAGRGFWPGLNCSLKHNSKFSSFNIVVKGSYMYEINNPLPFSLISLNNQGKVQVYPGYWFLHNMYALKRNSWKYEDRDRRQENFPYYDFNFLAPDTIEEMFSALEFLEKCAEYSFRKVSADNVSGDDLLNNYDDYGNFTIYSTSIENRNRAVDLHKPDVAYSEYKKMINFYSVSVLIDFFESGGDLDKLVNGSLKTPENWINCGSMFVPKERIDLLISKITENEIDCWESVHKEYRRFASLYKKDKAEHAFSSLLRLNNISVIEKDLWERSISSAIEIRTEIKDRVVSSREKDYKSSFRKITYDNPDEMLAVLGKPEDNSFFAIEEKECEDFIKRVTSIKLKEIF